MKNITIALSVLTMMASVAVAQEQKPDRPQRPERPDPVEVSNKLVADFDKDKSGALNKEELEQALASLRQNRAPGPRGNPDARQARPGGEDQRQQRPDRQRPEQGNRPPRPEGRNMADMFMQRGDTDKSGELNAQELAEALQKMQRGRPGNGPRGTGPGGPEKN